MKRMYMAVLWLALLALAGGALAGERLFPVAPAEAAQTDVSMTDAIQFAKAEMAKQQGMPGEEFQNYRIKAGCVLLENGGKAWIVTLDEKGYGWDALVTLAAEDGAVIDYQATDSEITSLLVKQWTERKGPMLAWTQEDQALFNWLFGDRDAYLMPDETHIRQEEAGAIALASITEPLASPELHYRFDHLSYTDGRPEQVVWRVTVVVQGREKYLVYVSATDGTVVESYALDGNG